MADTFTGQLTPAEAQKALDDKEQKKKDRKLLARHLEAKERQFQASQKSNTEAAEKQAKAAEKNALALQKQYKSEIEKTKAETKSFIAGVTAISPLVIGGIVVAGLLGALIVFRR